METQLLTPAVAITLHRHNNHSNNDVDAKKNGAPAPPLSASGGWLKFQTEVNYSFNPNLMPYFSTKCLNSSSSFSPFLYQDPGCEPLS